ncbi:hypothetical protein EYZ11_013259 [Aspergillus tanneri]|uniref:Aldehyde dehydrogenase domain-containing protein n=1 Tax=Aspergillus tanneri TaxID=1220188 RepID=A0A4S3IYD1_9EURO|nr:hypothetical protein EYZ11_013259 [Aspergillus tanneri]
MIVKDTNRSRAIIPLMVNNKPVTTETTFQIHNPANGEVIEHCSSASIDNANHAVEAAKAAFPAWSKKKPYDRRDILFKAANIMLLRKEELIRYQMEETGAGRLFVEKTLSMGISFIKDFAARIPSIEGTVPAVSEDGECAMVFKEPYGVILGIAPWNAPYILGTRSIALPLAAGNTVVLKGSELSPKCFWVLADIFREAGLPAGCLNVIYHRPSDAAAVTTALIANPAVRKISFTGSTTIGSIVASTAGKYVKPVLLELGGKASAIVLDDANLDKAAMCCALGAFMHVVQRSIAEKFCQLLTDATEKVFGTHVAAPVLVASAAVKKNKDLVTDALSKGADVVFGDANASDEGSNSMRPLIIGNVTKDMDLYSTESFGPTVSLIVVDDEEEAIALANDTEYGLSSAVFTDSLFRGLKVAKQIESG